MQATSTQKGAFRLHRQVTYLPWGKHPGRVVVFCFVFFFPSFFIVKLQRQLPFGLGIYVGIGATTLRQKAGMLSGRKGGRTNFSLLF